MSIILKQFNPEKGAPGASFFIQCKGEHSGRPLKAPIPNCFAVYTTLPGAYEIAFAAFKSKIYHTQIKGSVIPFITLNDCKEILLSYAAKIDSKNEHYLKKIQLLDELIKNEKQKLKTLELLITATARQIK